MKKTIKTYFKAIIPKSVIVLKRKMDEKRQFKNWEKDGCPVPPPHIVKQFEIETFQKIYGYNTFIETGTYIGDMVEAQKRKFKKIISIELSDNLAKNAQLRFKKDENIKIVQGDSGKVLVEILKTILEPAIFWLDGHYSAGITAKGEKDCPIFEELDAIFSAKKNNHILLIDDARFFIGQGDYPTIEELTSYIQSKDERYKIEVKNDIIRYFI